MESQYLLIDSGNLRKLERVGPYTIERPSGQAIWAPRQPESVWQEADAVFIRNAGGDGRWKFNHKKPPSEWTVTNSDLKFVVRLTDFGHIGLFPEHHDWQRLADQIERTKARCGSFRLLNLFAYTGATSLAAAKLGGEVVHIDASKASVSWARENAAASDLTEANVRWIVEDVQKFLAREVRRKNTYHGVVLDPPSFGRGPKGNLWKLEENLPSLLGDIRQVLDKDFSFLQLSAHSQGMTPIALSNLVEDVVGEAPGKIDAYEMVITEGGPRPRQLPSGACAVYQRWGD